MKIGIVSSSIPHVDGGYRKFVNGLVPHLRSAGHQVEKIWLPYSSDPRTMLMEMVGFRLLRLEDSCDQIICCRPPSYVLKHPNKIVWFIHHERIFYDLWDSEYNTLPKTAYWKSYRKALIELDTKVLAEAKKVFTNSKLVKQRLLAFNNVKADVLYPPVSITSPINEFVYGPELLFVCRISHHKRQHLAIKALAETQTPVRLRIAGVADNGAYLNELLNLVNMHNLQDRVTIDHRWISEGEKQHLLSMALAAVYIPLDEDSYGYPTIEAALNKRPVVTVSDSGAVLEFVEDNMSGIVSLPTPTALASSFDRLWSNRILAEELGAAAFNRLEELGINWGTVVESLTQ